MPVYNGEQYLQLAIDSILAQSMEDFELIIVNDGSTDDSLNIITSVNDDRIKVIDQKNQGVARSLNNAIKVAKGKYIRRHDADDISTADNLKNQINFLESHPEYPLVSSQIAYMTDNGKIARKIRNPQTKFFHGSPYIEVDYSRYIKFRPVIHATVLMKRDALIELGGYRPEFLTSEDVDLWLRFLDKYKIAVINDCSYFVRLHNTSATKTHASSVNYYRDLAFDFAKQRRIFGLDNLQKGIDIILPENNEDSDSESELPDRALYRDDLIFYYSILVNSRDWSNLYKVIWVVLKKGWRDIRNWKLLTFPLLGRNLVIKAVRIKRWCKNLIPVS